MSLNSAMLAGVSGLQANSAALAAISNDIANVNTVGYKGTDVDFESLVTAASDSGSYSAGGVTHRRPSSWSPSRARPPRPPRRPTWRSPARAVRHLDPADRRQRQRARLSSPAPARSRPTPTAF